MVKIITGALENCALLLFVFNASVWAGSLDDSYLKLFGEVKETKLTNTVLLNSGNAVSHTICGTPDKRALQRDWNKLEASTQKVLAKQLSAPVLSSEATYVSTAGHFKIHYTSDSTSTDAPPQADVNSNGIPDWVETVATTFEDVYAAYVVRGYKPAPTAGGAPYDIYLKNLAPQGYYGVTNSGSPVSATYPNAFTSWMELDNNFTDSIYKPSIYSPLQSLQITAAHEYHHAIQYGYTFYFDIWYAEATSSWMEDELYDSVNQLYSYTPAWFNNSTAPLDLAVDANAVSSGAGYGRWIFNRYLTEAYSTQNAVRSTWEKVGTLSSPSGNDIPMVPVMESVLAASTFNSSLGDAFFGFAKRYYQRNWASHATDLAKIPAYSPVTSYTTYPVNASASTFKPAIALSHYSFAYYRFLPSVGGSSALTINLAASNGIKTAAFRKDAGGTITELTFNQSNGTYNDASFGSTQEVVLLIANVTNTDGQNANFSTDGSTVAVTPPSTTPVTTIPVNDTTPPNLALTDPTQDISTIQGSIVFSGIVTDSQTTPTLTISVDNQTYTPVIGLDGSFSQSIVLGSDKIYSVIATATDQGGNKTTVTRNITKYSVLSQPVLTDALKVFQSVAGTASLTATEKLHFDVAPLGNDGKPHGNGSIDDGDVILILRRLVGIGSW